MLVEIYCEKFRTKNGERGPIRFHEGLNVVLGDRRAKNSIGKTTFLLAIDYALGGSQYTKGSDNMLEEVGDHDICFTYRFDGIEHSFLRSTSVPNIIWECDRTYQRKSQKDIEDFKDWLGAMYGMHDLGGSFGTLLSPFMRIFGMDHSDLHRPLQVYAGEKLEGQLARLLMLYGQYLPVSKLDEQCRELTENKDAFEDARKFNHISAAKNKTEYKANQVEIKRIQDDLGRIYEAAGKGAIDVEPEKAEYISHLKATLKQLRRQRTIISRRAQELQDSLSSTNFTQSRDFDDLRVFFDNVNIKRIEEIEGFHKGISRIMKAKLKDEISAAELEAKILDEQIRNVQSEIEAAGSISSLSKVTLDRVGSLSAELVHYEEANEAYDRAEVVKEQLNSLKRQRDAEEMKSFSDIEISINSRIAELNREAVGPLKTAPVLSITSPKKYSFVVPKDGGAGSKNRAVFLLDMTLLEQTPLPLVIHDSVGIKQIEDENTVGLLEVYSKSDKQVFVAIDKAESYFATGEVPPAIRRNTVLELSDGNELFGWSWNLATGEEER